MRPYQDLSDEELKAEMTAFRNAKREMALGGVGVIAGEGRRVEFTRSNTTELNQTLRDLYYEAGQRGWPGYSGSGAIAVEIGR